MVKCQPIQGHVIICCSFNFSKVENFASKAGHRKQKNWVCEEIYRILGNRTFLRYHLDHRVYLENSIIDMHNVKKRKYSRLSVRY